MVAEDQRDLRAAIIGAQRHHDQQRRQQQWPEGVWARADHVAGDEAEPEAEEESAATPLDRAQRLDADEGAEAEQHPSRYGQSVGAAEQPRQQEADAEPERLCC